MNLLSRHPELGDHGGMSFDLEPLELLAAVLTAVMLALPIAFPLAAGVLAAPRRVWSGAGLGLGLGLLLGVIITSAASFVGLHRSVLLLSSIGLLLGLLGAIVAAVLLVVRPEGSTLTAAVGIVVCVLIGLGEPSQTLPAMLGISRSPMVVVAGVVIQAVVVVVVVGALVAASGRVRALQIGVAAAGAVAAVMLAGGVFANLMHEFVHLRLPSVPLGAQLIVVVVTLVIGTVLGGALGRSSAQRRDLEARRSQA